MRTIALFRAKLEGTTFLGGGARKLRERDQLWVVPLAIVGIAGGLAGVVFLLYQNFRAMAMVGQALGSPDLALYLAVIVAWALVFILGFPIAISVLYFSRDTRMLAALPIAPGVIVGAHIMLLYLYALPVSLVVMITALVASAPVVSSVIGGFAYWALGTIIALIAPVVPLALATLLVTLLTRVVNLSRFRTALETLGMLLLVVLLVGVQLLLSRSLAGGHGAVTLSQSLQTAILAIRSAVPPAGWYVVAFAKGGLVRFSLAIATTAILGLLTVEIVQRGYLRQIASQASTQTRRHHRSPGSVPNQRSTIAALVIRELRLLGSNSTFLFESVGEVLVFPIILLVMRVSLPGSIVVQAGPLIESLSHILPVMTVALILFAAINSVSSAAISREGRTFDLSLSLPLAGSTQVRAKVATYLLLFVPAFVANSILLTWLLARPWWYAPVVSAAGLPFVWLVGVTTIYADIRRPKLDWNHPQQAVKQNVNVLIGMGIAILAVAATAAPAFVAASRGVNDGVVLALGGGFAVIVASILTRQILRYADSRYAQAFSAGS